MFKAFTVNWDDIPKDVNRDAFETEEEYFDDYYDDYLVVQVDGKTIYCKSETSLSEVKRMEMIMELMELAYYLGVLAGVKHEQGFMDGRNLRGLDEAKRLRPGGYQNGDIIKVDLSTGETEYFKNELVQPLDVDTVL